MLYELKLPGDMLDVVLNALAQQPYGRVAKIVEEIVHQVQPQNAAVNNTASDVMEASRANGSAKELN